MKPGKYLRFHFKCLEKGEMPDQGLCFSLRWPSKLELFKPDADDGEDDMNNMWYWGHGGRNKGDFMLPEQLSEYTSLRQNIVLFMAAMNNEL